MEQPARPGLSAARSAAERDAARALARVRENRANRLIGVAVAVVLLAIIGGTNYFAWKYGIPPYTNRNVQITSGCR